MERESFDEEEDLETLINSSENKNGRSTFEISEIGNRFSRNSNFSLNKWYLLGIGLPLFLILMFFLVDISGLFSSFSNVNIYSHSNQTREAELQALYLLNIQQSALLNLWNRTLKLLNSNVSLDANLTINENELLPLFRDLRSGLLNQLTLNQKIQKFLLSSHGNGNVSGMDDISEDSSLGGGICRKVELTARRRTIEWKPNPNRYLFAVCVSGQMSNHLICLEKHMFFAALLNRILVLPSPKFDYQYDRVVDISHINECFGRTVVTSFEEFYEMKKHRIHINRFICYVAQPLCFIDDEHINKLKSLGISMGKMEAAWPGDGKPDPPKKRRTQDILPMFSCEDEVLAVGDIFYASVDEDWVMQPRGPLEHTCKTIIQPSRIIILTAQRLIQTFLGGNFIALHFRRHGFLKFCNAKVESCFFPIPQAADCILHVVKRAKAPIIYLSTDAAESETELLQSLITMNGRTVPLFKRPSHTGAEKWDAYLWRHHLGGDEQVDAMLDKTICAMSSIFIGAAGSTFTEDILRLRRDWGLVSDCDEYLCSGKRPNFIAEEE